jgi:parallel beta-helix repeat protein
MMKKLIIATWCLFSCAAIMAQPLTFKTKLKLTPTIYWANKSNITIRDDSIDGNGANVACIRLTNCTNVHITHCKILNTTNYGIYLFNCSNVVIDSNYITKAGTGVFAQSCPLGGIQVNFNTMLNITGMQYNKDFVQFALVNGPGNRIDYNRLENIQGKSNPEDGINLYQCYGSPTDYIYVMGNWIRGGGPSTTGSGITVADQGGSYQLVLNNVVINSGYIGIQAAGGTFIRIQNNTITSTAFSWSHLGLGYGNFSGKPSNNITISGNKVNWICGLPADVAKGMKQFDMYYQDGAVMPGGWTTNVGKCAVATSMITAKLIDVR